MLLNLEKNLLVRSTVAEARTSSEFGSETDGSCQGVVSIFFQWHHQSLLYRHYLMLRIFNPHLVVIIRSHVHTAGLDDTSGFPGSLDLCCVQGGYPGKPVIVDDAALRYVVPSRPKH